VDKKVNLGKRETGTLIWAIDNSLRETGMNSKRFGIVGLIALCAVGSIPAIASDDTPSAAASGQSTPSTQDAPTAASAPAADVSPGPLLNERQALYDHIQQAGAHGIGTANYKLAFKSIEDQVAAGATESQIKPRVDQLTSALKEQLMRAQVLKTQKPLPPTASQQGEPPPVAGGSVPAAAGSGSSGNAALIDKLKDKLGSGGMPSADVVDKFLNSDKGKDLLKKLGQ
jgi:hypothetical protein